MKRNEIHGQFVRFIIIGILATTVNYGSYYICLDFLKIHYLVSAVIGFMVGVICGFWFNKKWTFNIQTHSKLQILKYFIVYGLSLGLSVLFLRCMVGYLGIDARIANVASIGLTTVTNFTGIKLFVFKNKVVEESV